MTLFISQSREYIFQKLLLAWNFSCINKKCFFIKETDIFGHIVVWTTYTSHIDHITPQHTAFEQSTSCLSVFLESLPGLIPITILWHTEWTLEKTVAWTWTTIIRLQYLEIFSPKMHKFLVEKYVFTIFAFELFKVEMENLNNTRNTNIWVENYVLWINCWRQTAHDGRRTTDDGRRTSNNHNSSLWDNGSGELKIYVIRYCYMCLQNELAFKRTTHTRPAI